MNSELPHSREMEEAAIGAVLINPDCYHDAVQIIEAGDFYVDRNAWVWEAFAGLTAKRIPIDIITTADELERHGRLGEIGGTAYLTAIASRETMSYNVEAYAKAVLGYSLRRKMIGVTAKATKIAYDEGNDPEQALTEIHTEFDRITPTYRPHSSPIGDRILAGAFEASTKGEVPGVATGLIALDKMLGGYMAEDLIYVAARPGVGKTGYLCTAFRAALSDGKHPAMFSMEMGDQSIGQRLIAQQYNLNAYNIRRGRMEAEQWDILRQGTEWLNELEAEHRFYISEKPAASVPYIHAVCKRLKSRGLLDIVFIDYVQLMSAKGENRHQQISAISAGLKALARDLQIPVVSAAQLRRDAENRQPNLSELKESGSLEQDADIVIFIWREGEPVTNTDIDLSIRMGVAKYRHGPYGNLMKNGNSIIQLRRSSVRFEDCAGG